MGSHRRIKGGYKMKKIIIIVATIVVLCAAIGLCTKIFENSKGYMKSDTSDGTATFEKISYDTGFGLNIDEGEFPIDVEMTSGILNIKISKGNDVIFEETGIDASKKITATIPETAFYMITVSGKKACGSLKYPVSESSNVPDIISDMPEENPEVQMKQDAVKRVLMQHYTENYEDAIQEVKYNKVKIYTKEEIENDEALKSLNLSENDIAFEVEYELKVKDGYKDIMQFTAATGEIDGQWVKEKYNCGVLKQKEDGTYELTNFGTGF